MEKLTFRVAREGDEQKILDFILALAKYEKMESDVVATPQLLHEWIFEKKKAEVIFPMVEGKEIGFALFFHNFSTFLGRAGLYLEDLFILEEYRGRGYAQRLVRYCVNRILENGKTAVLTTHETNKAMIQAAQRAGFEIKKTEK